MMTPKVDHKQVDDDMPITTTEMEESAVYNAVFGDQEENKEEDDEFGCLEDP